MIVGYSAEPPGRKSQAVGLKDRLRGRLRVDARRGAASRVARAPAALLSRASDRGLKARPAVAGSLSLFVPGAGQLVQGRWAPGLFFATWMGFLATLAWALLETIDRLAVSLPLLGSSVLQVFGLLGVIYVMAAVLHVGSAVTAARPGQEALGGPLPAALASALLPGWGQLLNGDRVRAALCLASVWIVAGAWIVACEPFTRLLNTYLPVVGPVERTLREPAVLWTARWTLPAVLWSLATYDAWCRAVYRERA